MSFLFNCFASLPSPFPLVSPADFIVVVESLFATIFSMINKVCEWMLCSLFLSLVLREALRFVYINDISMQQLAISSKAVQHAFSIPVF